MQAFMICRAVSIEKLGNFRVVRQPSIIHRTEFIQASSSAIVDEPYGKW